MPRYKPLNRPVKGRGCDDEDEEDQPYTFDLVVDAGPE